MIGGQHFNIVTSTVIDIKREIGNDPFKEMSVDERITHTINGIKDFMNRACTMPCPDWVQFAIELPILSWDSGKSKGRGFRNKSTIDQGRLFQAIVDCAKTYNAYVYESEVNVSTAKSSAIHAGQQMKKWRLHELVVEKYRIQILQKVPNKHVEAVLDAFVVATGFDNLVVNLPKSAL